MPKYFNHPMLYRTLFFSFAVLTSVLGCTKDEDPVKEIKPDAAVAQPAVDMGPAIPLPVAITDIFKFIPDAPAGIHARSGDTAKTVLSHPKVKRVKGFSRLLRETKTKGPFHQVQYQLTQDQNTVERVIATFHRQYARNDRHEAIIEMITVRLGKPKETKTDQLVRHVWSLPTFGIEIRKDLSTKAFSSSRPLDLIFDRRLKYEAQLP
ncbi:MAG: hypothetical protein ACPGQS_03495 [Bradymonadia bacterium]